MVKKSFSESSERVGTGIKGFDEILGGGLPANRLYLIQGSPGTGKTTLAMHFLLEAVRLRQSALYVTLSESKEELLQSAKSHGWTLDGIAFHEMEKLPDSEKSDGPYTFYHPADVELVDSTSRLYAEVDRVKPHRVVFDSLSEMRLLAQDPLRYRRQILGLKKFFASRLCTVLLLDDLTSLGDEEQLETIAHGVVRLENSPTDYGTTARRLLISKMRGIALQEGFHDFQITTDGLHVYPRLNAAAERPDPAEQATALRPATKILSGIDALDRLLAGGIEPGTSALVIGPSGSGKSSLVTQYVWQALKRKERVACYLFEESRRSFLMRAEGQGMNLSLYLDRGSLIISRVDPSKLSPGEFAFRVKEEVQKEAKIVLIDSLNGYLNAMPSERFLVIQMYELLTYLSDRGVLTLLVLAQYGLLGNEVQAPVDVSYMADTVILLRSFEICGVLKKTISILKKRSGSHDSTTRELKVTSHGIDIGIPFQELGAGQPAITPNSAERQSRSQAAARRLNALQR